ncbi:MAG: hypothetical protein B7Y35_11315 [Sphingomonadales bacterium 28-64-96]|nr:MAG: hypothetical protein B7Y35_11315 [Sphingomonadales bacterium 28-64-96]
MAKSNDPLIDSLMQMAVAAAPLIRKARESGIFRDRDTVVDAEIVTPEAPKPPEPPKAAEPPPVSPDTSALQDIVVRQALRINELEAEVAALKAKAAKPAAKKAGPKAKPKVRPAKA